MKEGNVLFNDTLNTFYLRLYGVSFFKMNNDLISEKGHTALIMCSCCNLEVGVNIRKFIFT